MCHGQGQKGDTGTFASAGELRRLLIHMTDV